MPAVIAPRRQGLKDHEFEARLALDNKASCQKPMQTWLGI